MEDMNFDREFDAMTTRVSRTFNLMMPVVIVTSVATSAAVIYLIYAAAKWLMANS